MSSQNLNHRLMLAVLRLEREWDWWIESNLGFPHPKMFNEMAAAIELAKRIKQKAAKEKHGNQQ